jgi:hypothetical protein
MPRKSYADVTFRGGGFIAPPEAFEINVEAFHAQTDLAFRQAQIARRGSHVAVVGLEFGDDHFIFECGHGGFQRAAGAFFGRILLLQRGRQVVGLNDLVRAQQRRRARCNFPVRARCRASGSWPAGQSPRWRCAARSFPLLLAELFHKMIRQQQDVRLCVRAAAAHKSGNTLSR